MSESEKPSVSLVASFFRIPMHVHVSWVGIFALISWTLATGYVRAYPVERPPVSYWPEALVACALLFISVLFHEMGHTVAALKYGLTIRSITLFAFGGVAQTEKEPEDGWTAFKVIAIGPLISLALAVLFYRAASLSFLGDGGRALAEAMAYTNLGLAGLNVVPALPLDGGRLLSALARLRAGQRRATEIASGAGTLLAFAVFTFGAVRLLGGDGVTALWCLLVSWFLKDAAAAAYARERLDEALRGLAVRDAMLTEVVTIPAHLSVSELSPEYFRRGGYDNYPVVRGDDVVGLLSVHEVLALTPEERARTSVQAVMKPLREGIVVGPGEPLLGAIARMARSGVGRLLVVQDGRLQGLLSMSSVFRHLRAREALSS